jgi:hypothetical protein
VINENNGWRNNNTSPYNVDLIEELVLDEDMSFLSYDAAYECVTHNGKNSKQTVIIVRAVDASQAKTNALVQARQQRRRHYCY